MNFTREPIIESIITPREGFKLTIKNSKGGNEEYVVDAIEVVSFGREAVFYRCLERPKAFLLPVGDYIVVETKETRVVLKNASIEKNIKIAGGKKEEKQQKKSETKTKTRGKQTKRTKKGPTQTTPQKTPKKDAAEPINSSMFRSLFPPPSSLISDKYKNEDFLSPDIIPVPEKPLPEAPEKTVDEISKDDPALPGIDKAEE